jgi:hypothetical protein
MLSGEKKIKIKKKNTFHFGRKMPSNYPVE